MNQSLATTMNLRQLHSLIWVAKLRNFGAAAVKLHTTQPTISIRIQELEKELGTKLFDRGPHGISLTAEGRECLGYAEQIVSWTAELQSCANKRKSPHGRVSLGVSEIIAHTWLADLLSALDEKYPDVKVDTTIDMTPPLLDGLKRGDCDVILIGAHRIASTYPTVALGKCRFVWVGGAERQARMQSLTPKDLQSRRIITYSKDAAIHQSIEDWFTQHGAYPVHRITCNTAVTMVTLAQAGLGITLVPQQLVTRELAKGSLRIIPTEPAFAPLSYHALYTNERRGALGKLVAEAANAASSFK